MRFTVVTSDKTVTWEDGFADDFGVYQFMFRNPEGWEEAPEGFGARPDLEDPVAAFRTIREYLFRDTGEIPQAGDEQAFALELEAGDYGEEYEENADG